MLRAGMPGARTRRLLPPTPAAAHPCRPRPAGPTGGRAPSLGRLSPTSAPWLPLGGRRPRCAPTPTPWPSQPRRVGWSGVGFREADWEEGKWLCLQLCRISAASARTGPVPAPAPPFPACPPSPQLQMGEWQGLLAGFTLGATHLVFFGAYALALWYGSRRVADGELDGGKVGTDARMHDACCPQARPVGHDGRWQSAHSACGDSPRPAGARCISIPA